MGYSHCSHTDGMCERGGMCIKTVPHLYLQRVNDDVCGVNSEQNQMFIRLLNYQVASLNFYFVNRGATPF